MILWTLRYESILNSLDHISRVQRKKTSEAFVALWKDIAKYNFNQLKMNPDQPSD